MPLDSTVHHMNSFYHGVEVYFILSPHLYLGIRSGVQGIQGETLCVFLITVNYKDTLFSVNIVHLSVFCKLSAQNAVVN